MKRRNALKSVAGMSLLPTISVLDTTDSVPFDYLDSLFQSDYTVNKNLSGVLGKTYSAEWEAENREYNMEYRVFSEAENKVDVYDNTEVGCVFKHYLYLPQNHYEAWTLCEIARNQGLESLLSTLDRLELEFEGKVTV